MSLILSFTLAMLLTASLMPVCLYYAGRVGLMDGATSDRKVHKGVMPRSGGVALVMGTGIAWLVWLPGSDELLRYLPLLICILLVAAVGLLDDRLDLRPSWKLAGQVVMASLVVASYGGFNQFPFMGIDAAPMWVSMPLTVVFIVSVTNAVNLSDGLDGLAAGNCLLSLAFLGLIAAQASEFTYVAIVLAAVGGLLGFLRFNTHPARVFMGDTGSLFLGFTAAALSVLILRSEHTTVSPALPLLIFMIPILDTANVIVRRWAGGRPIFGADRSHLHHQLLELGYRHYEAVMVLYACQAAALVLAWPLRHQSDLMIVTVFAVCSAAVLGFVMVARRRGWKAHRSPAAAHDRRRSMLRKLPWYRGRSGEVIASLLVAAFLIGAMEQTPPAEVKTLSLICAGLFLVAWALAPTRSELLCRIVGYSVAALLVYGPSTTGGGIFHSGIDGLLILIAGALVIGLRVTRKREFHLDSQDYLMLFVIAGVLLVSLGHVDRFPLAEVLLRLVIILYAIEFVLARRTSLRRWLNTGGITALGLLAA